MAEKLLDTYELKARIVPGIIIAFPLVVTAIYASPGLSNWSIFAGGSLCTLALLYGLSHVVRARGEAIERQLWTSWGGPPSTRFMRHRDSTWSSDLKTRIARMLADKFSIRLLTAAEEAVDWPQADKLIADGFRQVRGYLRQHDADGLWFKHNVEYGFSRNLLGCRVLWVLISAGSMIFAVILARYTGGSILNLAFAIATLSLICAAYAGWLVLPSSIKLIADGYAETAWMAFLGLTQQDHPAKSAASVGKGTTQSNT